MTGISFLTNNSSDIPNSSLNREIMKNNYFQCLLFVLVSLLSLSASGQNILFKVGGGVAKHQNHSRTVGAYRIGLGYEYEMSQRWTLSASLCYYGKGWKQPNQTTFVLDDDGAQRFDPETGEPLTSVMNVSATANYLELPLLANYYWRVAEAQYIMFSGGPYVAYGIGGKCKTRGDGTAAGAEKFYYTNPTFSGDTHRFDAGLQFALGYQFHNGLVAALETDIGLAKFSRQGARNLSLLVSFTYKLNSQPE